ncbi:MAG: protein kinase [Acidimicrobiales bacterium]|nr:protein kinase [Acidimicrobiales bacterium]
MADEKVDIKVPGVGSLRLVRRGDHSALYRGVQENFNREVAVKAFTVKALDRAAQARFEQECAAMGVISVHPHTLTVFDSGVAKRRPYIVTEWLSRGNEHDRLVRSGPFDWREAADIGVKVAGALESAHRAGVLHQNLKPHNVFVSPLGEPLLGDFEVSPAGSFVTRSGDPRDTQMHAAPELFTGGQQSVASDIYSLGSIIFTLIAGHPPFEVDEEEPLVRVIARAASDPVPDLRPTGVPPGVCGVLEWAMAKAPGERPPTVRELGRFLQAAQQAAGQPPTRLALLPETDADRALPLPALPAALLTRGGAPAAPPGPPVSAAPAPAPPPAAPAPPTPAAPPPPAPVPGAPPPPPAAAPPVPAPAAPAPPPAAPAPPPAVPAPPPAAPAPPPAAPAPVPGAPPPPPATPDVPVPPPAPEPVAAPPAPEPVAAPPAPEPVAPAAAASTPVEIDSSLPLATQTRQLLRAALAAYADRPGGERLRQAEARLDDPLRVAIAGKVKAGKSTLLNALVGDELAPTDAGECTKIVAWYTNGNTYRATLFPSGAEPRQTPFSREHGAIEVDLQGLDPGDIDRIVVEWPSASLAAMTLIDTPGLASVSEEISKRTEDFLALENDRDTPADAVLYLMRHFHRSDARFLEAFHAEELAHPSPVNAIAILSRADELGSGRPDALESAQRVATRYRGDARIRRLCQTVLPVAGLLAQSGATLREAEYQALAAIAALPPERLGLLLASADRFVADDPEVPLTQVERADLVRRLGLFGVGLAVQLIAAGEAPDSDTLSTALVERSGVEDLRRVLMTQFAARRELLKARAALLVLQAVLRDDPIAASPDLAFALERVQAGAHEFTELRLFNAFRSGAITFRPEEEDEVDRLLGALGTSPAARLGLAEDASTDALRTALFETIARWRQRAESPMTSRDVAEAAAVLVRSCEGMLATMTAVPA